jgi:hypothetical protein
MIKVLLIVTTLAGGNYTSELPDMKSCLEARIAITKQDNTVKSLCIPKSDESAKMREFFGIFMGMVDQIVERQELERLNREENRTCSLCTESE